MKIEMSPEPAKRRGWPNPATRSIRRIVGLIIIAACCANHLTSTRAHLPSTSQLQVKGKQPLSETARSQEAPTSHGIGKREAANEESADEASSVSADGDSEEPSYEGASASPSDASDYTTGELEPAKPPTPRPIVRADRQAQPRAAAATGRQEPVRAVDVNMGADRLLVQPPANHRPQHPTSTSTESSLLIQSSGPTASLLPAPVNERRQDLLYPTPSVALEEARMSNPQPSNYLDQEELAKLPGVCYTPLALLLVILVTVMITVTVCFCTHVLVRHLNRHQFDLIENSKSFDAKHSGGYLQEARNQQAADWRSPARHLNGDNDRQQVAGKRRPMLGLFNGRPGEQVSGSHRDLVGCAFDNPYFREDNNNQFAPSSRPAQQQIGLLAAGAASTGGQPESGQQLHFIEHHISNLHSRQVTSSVNELSILGGSSTLDGQSAHQAAPVVDLTSADQRAKVIADPKEGDLVAVDITGHDFIGLGFDVCGNHNEGIFVRSLLARGPAKESGCIEPGDRIKCLNISFDDVTLEDACDLLNCGSPYKMRLLLEKRAAPVSALNRLVSPMLLRPRIKPKPIDYQISMASQEDEPIGGPLSATKTYIKRLTKLVSSSGNAQRHQHPAFSLQHAINRTAGPISGDCSLLSPIYLGSAAARQRPQQEPFEHRGHTNAGYGADESAEDFPAWRSRDQLSVVGSDIMFGSSTTGLNADGSLDYQPKHANHKLRGPLGRQVGQEAVTDLHLATSQEASGGHKPLSKSHHRRQSLAATSEMGANISRLRTATSLEQTQSQPEIAQTADTSDDHKQPTRELAPSFVEPDTREGKRSPLVNANSDPAVNSDRPDWVGPQQQIDSRGARNLDGNSNASQEFRHHSERSRPRLESQDM